MGSQTSLERWFGAAKFRGRNARYRAIFGRLGELPLGAVLDVGGGTLVDLDVVRALRFDSWSVVEVAADRLPTRSEDRVRRVRADGNRLPFRPGAFDTAMSIQVLEHVFEPFAMVQQLVEAVRPDGLVVLVVPQTANLHDAPGHYQNFTRYWLEETAHRLDLDIVSYEPLGGLWSSTASRLLLQYAAVLRIPGHHEPSARRGPLFWLLFPLGLLVTLAVVPLSLALSVADLEEEANNHMIVLRKR